jgi:hypothetical protein
LDGAGRIVGIRFETMDLPEPGGPIISIFFTLLE